MGTPMENVAFARKHNNKYNLNCVFHSNGCICSQPPINSHNIQNSGILRKLAVDNHVYTISENSTNDSFDLQFKKTGISNATIFRCLCSAHDKALFADIEDRPYLKDKRQNFLFALKSLLYEYWKKSMSQSVIASNYLKNPLISKMVIQYNCDYEYCYQYLDHFWNLLECEKYDELITICFELPYEVNFSTSDTINILRKFNGELINEKESKYPFCHISIFPQGGKSFILISWLKEDDYYYKIFLNQLTMLSAKGLADRLNVLLPILAENIVISPLLYEAWTAKARENFIKLCSLKTSSFYFNNPVSIDHWVGDVTFDLFKNIDSERK